MIAVNNDGSATDAFAHLINAGYEPGAPHTVPPEHVEIDRETAGLMRCGRCRRRGLLFCPWSNGRSYRALCWCPLCMTAEEL